MDEQVDTGTGRDAAKSLREPGPSPLNVVNAPPMSESAAATDLAETPRPVMEAQPTNRLRDEPLEQPLAKRKRTEEAATSIQDSVTPTIASEEHGQQSLPPYSMVAVKRASSTSSVSSELSYTSLGSSGRSSTVGRLESLSPLPHHHDSLPPAPPSTPASHAHIFRYWESDDPQTTAAASSQMIPTFASVANAAQLERQQLRDDLPYAQLPEEGPATPALPRGGGQSAAPTYSKRKATHKTATNHNAKDDFCDWSVGKRYELIRMLGRGSYGEVAQATDQQTGRPVAIKRVTNPFDQPIDAVRLYREIHILKRMVGHESIIQLLGIIQPPDDNFDNVQDLYMVFEYVDTDLYKLIMSPQYLTTEHIQAFLYQMLAGLKYIHSHSVIHRDLKPANILLNEDCSLKICDFGLARIVDVASMSTSSSQAVGKANEAPVTFGPAPLKGLTRQLTKHVVTRWYRSPELILIQPYTSAVDIWSIGCILAELLSMQEGNVAGYQDRQPLFPGGTCYPLSGDGVMNKDEKLDQLSVIFRVIGTPSKEDLEAVGKANEYITSLGEIKGKSFESMYPAADPAALDLLKQMLHFNPKKRCTAEQALEHPFFKGIRRRELERNAPGPLEGPDFLEARQIDIDLVKQKTLEECIGFVPRAL